MANKIRKILRKKQVLELTGQSDTTVYRKELAGEFPKRIQIGKNAVGWYADEISKWINDRPRGGGTTPTAALAARE